MLPAFSVEIGARQSKVVDLIRLKVGEVGTLLRALDPRQDLIERGNQSRSM
jgi:hypothetical protein